MEKRDLGPAYDSPTAIDSPRSEAPKLATAHWEFGAPGWQRVAVGLKWTTSSGVAGSFFGQGPETRFRVVWYE
jgi:hypothetical protein